MLRVEWRWCGHHPLNVPIDADGEMANVTLLNGLISSHSRAEQPPR